MRSRRTEWRSAGGAAAWPRLIYHSYMYRHCPASPVSQVAIMRILLTDTRKSTLNMQKALKQNIACVRPSSPLIGSISVIRMSLYI